MTPGAAMQEQTSPAVERQDLDRKGRRIEPEVAGDRCEGHEPPTGLAPRSGSRERNFPLAVELALMAVYAGEGVIALFEIEATGRPGKNEGQQPLDFGRFFA